MDYPIMPVLLKPFAISEMSGRDGELMVIERHADYKVGRRVLLRVGLARREPLRPFLPRRQASTSYDARSASRACISGCRVDPSIHGMLSARMGCWLTGRDSNRHGAVLFERDQIVESICLYLDVQTIYF